MTLYRQWRSVRGTEGVDILGQWSGEDDKNRCDKGASITRLGDGKIALRPRCR